MLPCSPDTDFAKNDAATKQMTTRLRFIGAPHDPEVEPISPGRTFLVASALKCLKP